jgi:hypothetical protein
MPRAGVPVYTIRLRLGYTRFMSATITKMNLPKRTPNRDLLYIPLALPWDIPQIIKKFHNNYLIPENMWTNTNT